MTADQRYSFAIDLDFRAVHIYVDRKEVGEDFIEDPWAFGSLVYWFHAWREGDHVHVGEA